MTEIRWGWLGGAFAALVALTALSWQMAARGTGLGDDLRQTATIRNESATGGRVLVGGGLHGGK